MGVVARATWQPSWTAAACLSGAGTSMASWGLEQVAGRTPRACSNHRPSCGTTTPSVTYSADPTRHSYGAEEQALNIHGADSCCRQAGWGVTRQTEFSSHDEST